MTAPAAGRPRALRVAGSAAVGLFFFFEGGCSSGRAIPASSSFKEISSSALAAYEEARARAWDPSRRFKALFRAEVSPRIGAIGRGYLSVWWDGASGALSWRTSAPIAGAGKGGRLRKEPGAAGEPDASPLPGKLASADLIACILGTPDAPASPSTLLDAGGRVLELRFPNGPVVKLQPGDGVPRRIEAKGPSGHATLVLERYGPWAEGEEVPPP